VNTQPIIRSLLETDLYKFTMWQALLHQFPSNSAEYRFVCRNEAAFPLALLADEVNQQLDRLCGLRFARDELDYLAALRFIKPDFIEFLRIFQLNRDFIVVRTDGDALVIEAHGPQVHVMPFEIYVLAIVNECYFRRIGQTDIEVGRVRLRDKITMLERDVANHSRKHAFEFFDFGIRRRFSGAWHDEVIATFKARAPRYFKGTSNVYLARKYGLVPIGTMAHEYLQTFQAVGVQLRQSQKAALEAWVQEYRGDLGVALTDVVGMDAFFADFDLYFAKLFDGLRHDSGDPVE
jgi:nicotinate phosphoribosyltransferase